MSDSQSFFFLFLLFGLYFPGFYLVLFWLLFSKAFLEAKRIRKGFVFLFLAALWMIPLVLVMRDLETDDLATGAANFILTLIYIPVYSALERRFAPPDPPTL